VKQCPECRSELADDAVACAHCGGSWQPDGGFQTPWDVEMARLAAERERKVEKAERIGRLGKPIPHWFLDSRSGCGAITLAAAAMALAAFLAVVAAVVR
jgi:hypothetical protein